MENIYNNYRNIVERAVLAGVITEESRDFYLSAIEDKDDSDYYSDLESLVSRYEDTMNVFPHTDTYNLQSYSDTKENIMDKKLSSHELNVENCAQNNLSDISGDTIENCSIFDLKIFKESDSTRSSEATLPKQRATDCSSIQKLPSAGIIPKVMKKPKRNQVIDFKVPIYINIKKKKAVIKPQTSKYSQQPKYEIPSTHNCKKNISSKFACIENEQHTSKWDLNLDKTIDLLKKMEKNDQRSSSEMKDFNCSKPDAYQSNNPNSEINVNKIQETVIPTKQNPTYTCSEQKEPDLNGSTQEFLSKYCNIDADKTHSHYSVKRPMAMLRRSKIHKDGFSKKHKHATLLKQPVNYSCATGTRKRSQLPTEKKSNKCKHCKCACSCKTMQHVFSSYNDIETASDDGYPLLEMPSTEYSRKAECNRLLNVNIICQFYPDSEGEKLNNTKDQDDTNECKDPANEEKCSNEDPGDVLNENEKFPSNKTIQRLSKMFTNMKINRKQKKRD